MYFRHACIWVLADADVVSAAPLSASLCVDGINLLLSISSFSALACGDWQCCRLSRHRWIVFPLKIHQLSIHFVTFGQNERALSGIKRSMNVSFLPSSFIPSCLGQSISMRSRWCRERDVRNNNGEWNGICRPLLSQQISSNRFDAELRRRVPVHKCFSNNKKNNSFIRTCQPSA